MKDLISGVKTMSRIAIAATAIPEPASMALLGLGGLVALRRRAHKA